MEERKEKIVPTQLSELIHAAKLRKLNPLAALINWNLRNNPEYFRP